MPDRFAVIGWPLGHSMSPVIHNASFEALGLDCVFTARPVSPSELDSFMTAVHSSGLRGLAVTIPHKTSILRYCSEQSKEVRIIGAGNTISVKGSGVLSVYNTDAAASSRSLREAGVRVAGRRVVVLGAGGAARAVCFQICRDGAASLVIANRTLPRAERLRDELIRRSRGVEVSAMALDGDELAESVHNADLLVNTTSVGMHPRVDECPVRPDLLGERPAVFDIIYNPVETKLIREAMRRGAAVVPGTDMLVYQAAEQEKIWLGLDPPVGIMREALLTELGRSR